jgi:hypothetical protein
MTPILMREIGDYNRILKDRFAGVATAIAIAALLAKT